MSGKKGLKNLRKISNNPRIIALDTNIFTYYLNKQSSFYYQAEQIFRTIAHKQQQAVTSILTLTELLSFKASDLMLEKLEQELLLIPNLKIVDVDRSIGKEAARIRRQYGFRLPDCLQLATAKQAKAQAFITNDKKLKRFRELEVLLLV